MKLITFAVPCYNSAAYMEKCVDSLLTGGEDIEIILVDTIVDLCTRRLPQNMGIPADQIQVLSPTRKNDAGTAALNMRLQAALNPPSVDKQEHKRGKILFRVGDRVMQRKFPASPFRMRRIAYVCSNG